MYTNIIWNPLSASAAMNVEKLWNALSHFESVEKLSALDIKVQRRRIMVTNFSQWLWLETTLVKECRRILAMHTDNPQAHHWIGRLLAKISSILLMRKITTQFRSTDYIPELPCQVYVHRISKTSSLQAAADTEEHTLQIFKTIMRHWLSFPDNGISEPRFYFIAQILQSFPSDVLLLDDVWHAYQNPRSLVFGRPHITRYPPSLYVQLFDRLQSHPLADPSSKEFEIATLIGNLFRSFSKLSIEPAPTNMQSHLGIPSPGTATEARDDSTENLGEPHASPEVQPLPVNQHTFKKFADYLRELLPLTDPNYSGLTTRLMENVMKDPDGLLPWRSVAPSLRTAYTDNGPYSLGNINKIEALYSALILRGVTFGCDVVNEDHHIFFNNLAEWNNLIAASSLKPDSYLCRPSVYGNAIYNRFKQIGRSKDMGTNYWNAIEGVDWGAMGQGDQRLFGKAVTFFKQFDLIGYLIAVLLAGDFACAGKFDMPSASEMGAYIKKISAGAVGCMHLQGTVPGNTTRKNCQTAFEALYDYLEHELSAEEKQRMRFSTIILEHAMCKYYKAVTQYLF